ncbi:MAG: TAXI family TRAP transporter solute-binding subunit [Xanthobacteraceae bacterium]
MNRRSIRVVLPILLAAAGAFGLAPVSPAQAEPKSITIGSNPAGSVYFLLASAFAKLFQDQLHIHSTAQPHAGSSVYLPLMDKGEITLGMNSSLDSGLAYDGKPPYERAMKKVRAIARVWILPYAYMAKENSGFKTVADLKGKTVVVKFKTNVSLAQANRVILSTAGLGEEDIKEVDSGGVVAGINMVVEGRADAATVALSMPAMRKADATVPGGLRILGLGPKANDEFMSKGMAGLRTMHVDPSKRWPFVRQPTTIAAFDTYMNAGTSVDDATAYAMAKAMYDDWKQLQKDYAPLRNTDQSLLTPADNPLPYHPGAVKFWKEAGIWTAENEKHDAGLLH